MIATDQFSPDVLPPETFSPEVAPHRGYFIFGLGIASLWFPIFAPFAWVWGRRDLQAMREKRMDREGWEFTDWGRLFGMVVSCGFIGAVVVCLAAMIFAFATPIQQAERPKIQETPQPKRRDLRPNPGQPTTGQNRLQGLPDSPRRRQGQQESWQP